MKPKLLHSTGRILLYEAGGHTYMYLLGCNARTVLWACEEAVPSFPDIGPPGRKMVLMAVPVWLRPIDNSPALIVLMRDEEDPPGATPAIALLVLIDQTGIADVDSACLQEAFIAIMDAGPPARVAGGSGETPPSITGFIEQICSELRRGRLNPPQN